MLSNRSLCKDIQFHGQNGRFDLVEIFMLFTCSEKLQCFTKIQFSRKSAHLLRQNMYWIKNVSLVTSILLLLFYYYYFLNRILTGNSVS